MCLILLAQKPSDDFKFVMASNRDEFYSRPTTPAHWWPDIKDLLAGKDLEQGGTWMGMSKNGKFAAVTNVRDFYAENYSDISYLSRGDLVKDFFISPQSSEEYISNLNYNDYLGCNLCLYDQEELSFFSSKGKEEVEKENIFVLGNKKIGEESKKINLAKEDFKNILKKNFKNSDLLKLMQSPAEQYEFEENTIKSRHGNEFLARFIKSKIYGTRSTTVMTINNDNVVSISEQLYEKGGVHGSITNFEFQIK
jgi:uncharacterized protein with NRDE domain